MGIYLNPGNDLFYSTVTYSEIYVDKTMLISFTNKCLFGENKEICVSRPRRFGKSMAENMLRAAIRENYFPSFRSHRHRILKST